MFSAFLGLTDGYWSHDLIHGSSRRQALKDGIAMQESAATTLQRRMAGGSTRTTLAALIDKTITMAVTVSDGTVPHRLAGVLAGGAVDVRLMNPGGLTGVRAKENTRASL